MLHNKMTVIIIEETLFTLWAHQIDIIFQSLACYTAYKIVKSKPKAPKVYSFHPSTTQFNDLIAGGEGF